MDHTRVFGLDKCCIPLGETSPSCPFLEFWPPGGHKGLYPPGILSAKFLRKFVFISHFSALNIVFDPLAPLKPCPLWQF